MNKKFTSVYSLIKLFSIISVFIFFSCGGENAVSSFSFQLGDKAAQNIHNAARNITGSDDGLYTVYLNVSQTFDRELEPEDEKNWQEMEEKLFRFDKEYTVSRQELSSKRFIVDNVPLNVNLMVYISVFYQDAFITSGYCENVVCKGAETQVHITLERPEYPDPDLGDDNLNGSISITSGKAVFTLTKTETGANYYNLLGDSFTLTMTAEDGSALKDAEMEAELHYGGKDIGSNYYQFNKTNGYFTFNELNTKGTYYVYVKGSYTIEETTLMSTASFPIYVSYSNVITVPDSGLVKITSLQEACDLAQKLADASDGTEGFSIYVSSTLTGPQSIKITNEKVSWIEVIGQNSQSDGTPTDGIDANNEGTALTITADVPVTLRGIKICNGKVADSNGGGLLIGGKGNITLSGCLLEKNEADYGGAIYTYFDYAAPHKTLTIDNGTKILNNTATRAGAGIYSNTILCLEDATITDNLAPGSQEIQTKGGAIYIGDNAVYIYGNTLIGNKEVSKNATEDEFGNKAYYGGGIYLDSGELYLGYKPGIDGPVETDFTGGIYYNYAFEGGGVYAATTTKTSMCAGEIAFNEAARNQDDGKGGSGFCVATNGNSDNLAVLNLKGSVHFDSANEICLGYGKGYKSGKVTVIGELTGATPVAYLRPLYYTKVVLAVSENSGVDLSSAVNYFAFTPDQWYYPDSYGTSNNYNIYYAFNTDGTGKSTGVSVAGEQEGIYKSKPDTVGDFVFDDGTALYRDLVLYISDTDKERIVAYIFYANGTQQNAKSETKENYLLEDRVLGIGVTNKMQLDEKTCAYLTNSPEWEKGFTKIALTDATNNSMVCIPLAESGNNATTISEIEKFEGTTEGYFNYESLEDFIYSKDNTTLYLPALAYAKDYATYAEITAMTNATSAIKEGWYVPSIAELSIIYKQKDNINSYLTNKYYNKAPKINKIENQLYWSSSPVSESESESENTIWYIDFSITSETATTPALKSTSVGTDSTGPNASVLVIKDFTE